MILISTATSHLYWLSIYLNLLQEKNRILGKQDMKVYSTPKSEPIRYLRMWFTASSQLGMCWSLGPDLRTWSSGPGPTGPVLNNLGLVRSWSLGPGPGPGPNQ